MADATLPPVMPLAHGFPPVARTHARVLILGSMPGVVSLQAGQYYAHPRNQFWPIMASLLGFDATRRNYAERLLCLLDAHIALWDVLQSCHRPGSLDADIAPDSIVTNDFTTFFRNHPLVSHVYFNGAAAESHFARHVLRRQCLPLLEMQRLPSTSPAHAALDFDAKLAAWRAISETLNDTPRRGG